MSPYDVQSHASLTGIAIHSGIESTVTFKPSSEKWVFFVFKGEKTPAFAEYVTDTSRGTTLGKINVVEHVLSAVSALGINSLEIVLSHNEPPAMDGSSLPFVQALKKAGFKKSDVKIYSLNEAIKLSDNDTSIEAAPYPGFLIDFTIALPGLEMQRFVFENNYEKEIAPARTFGYIEELEMLKKRGLAKGASLDTALGLSAKGYINKPRFDNEPVRHKILDLIGDLALVGAPIHAKIIAVKSGHKLNVSLARRIRGLFLKQGGV